MHITRYTDYALRVLIYLGMQRERLATIGEIAGRYAISRNHLMKVVHELGRMGYVDTVRGKNGGMRLGRRPEEISIGAVIRDTEEDFALAECFGGDNQCVITVDCRLRSVLGEALDAFFRVLDGYTLADLLPAAGAAPIRFMLPPGSLPPVR